LGDIDKIELKIMKIEKIARIENAYLRPVFFDNRARDCWQSILEYYLKEDSSYQLILPAYIGWSSNEGSGIFDPVRNLRCNFSFYKLNNNLQIDIEYFKNLVISSDHKCLVLLVHYFGFPDARYLELVYWLKVNKVDFIEDCAHALLSDYVGNTCGKMGAMSFYSLHKLLPLKKGGMLVINNNLERIEKFRSVENINLPWEYDLNAISEKRRSNYSLINKYLNGNKDIEILYPELPDGICPQTFPIKLKKNRDLVYKEMNEAGFGMVSLYHTMIREINCELFPDSYDLSKHIINFPVHQDIDFIELKDMVYTFNKIYDKCLSY